MKASQNLVRPLQRQMFEAVIPPHAFGMGEGVSYQKTLSQAVSCTGIGLHSGQEVGVVLKPAPENHGIAFIRTDIIAVPNRIPARFDHVVDTKLCTVISNEFNVSVSTIEHLMAALWACEVDNAIIEIDGPEVPVMDGSSSPYVFLIECAGVVEQAAARQVLQVISPVEVREEGKSLTIFPATDFRVDFTILYPGEMIHAQNFVFESGAEGFRKEISSARTFGFKRDVEWLKSHGFARGGSLRNAVVIDGDNVLNEGGFRVPDECVRHKVLDCIGDLYLAGYPIQGHIKAICSGHTLNNKLLRALMASEDQYLLSTPKPSGVLSLKQFVA